MTFLKLKGTAVGLDISIALQYSDPQSKVTVSEVNNPFYKECFVLVADYFYLCDAFCL